MNPNSRPPIATLWCALASALLLCAASLHASPITPSRDDEVIDVLPAMSGSRAEERRLRKQLAQQPRDPTLALAAAQRYLGDARTLGDPRFAGMAMAAIAAWPDAATIPDDLLLMRATLQQYLHEFDASIASLQRLLARPGPARPQALLTLATVQRVQGRYADSDASCQRLARVGAALHANACLAENAALRGDTARARQTLTGLLAVGRHPPQTRSWLTTSLAELEQRAGNAAAADAAFRAALVLDPDPYATLAYADFLIEQKRAPQALALLKTQVRSDAVLLRLAISGTQTGAASAAGDAAEMRSRIALANERPDARVFHGREQAIFSLAVEHDAPAALALARANAAHQREPLDLLVLAQAARACGQAQALQEVQRLVAETGLVDQRIQALL
jgi:tetratricopeptide (TPR) repeat protein